MPMLEELAELEHDQWVSWTKYFLDNYNDENVNRWRRQVNQKYSQLSESEKESDRVWAKRVIQLIQKYRL